MMISRIDSRVWSQFPADGHVVIAVPDVNDNRSLIGDQPEPDNRNDGQAYPGSQAFGRP